MIKLFNVVDGVPEVSAESRMIIEFRAIIDRAKTREQKEIAEKELAFVYYTTDVLSYIVSEHSKVDRDSEARKTVGLPDTWSADKIVKEACQRYEKIQMTASITLLNDLRSTLYTASGLVRILEKKIQSYITKQEQRIEDDEPLTDEEDKKLETAIKNLKNLMSIAKDIPQSIESASKLEERVKKEIENEKQKKSGKEISDFENPDYLN